MDNNKDISYIVFEGEMARAERHIKRLWITLIITILLLVACNLAWIVYEMQYSTVSYTQDGEGVNNVNIGEQGDINNGTDSKDKTAQERQSEEASS